MGLESKQIKVTVVLVALFVFMATAPIVAARGTGNVLGFDAIPSDAKAPDESLGEDVRPASINVFEPLSTVQATGRVVYSDAQPIEEIRRRALSEALYFAALQGGAHVDGFSSVDQATTLTEQILVQPSSNLLDYRIVSEARNDLHYEVLVEAVMGDPDQSSCGQNTRRTVSVFAPTIYVAPSVEAWAERGANTLLNNILSEIKNNPNIVFRNAMTQRLDIEARQVSDNMNYASIMSGSKVSAGDFAIVPVIQIVKEETRKFGVVDVGQYKLIVQLNIYEGKTYRLLNSKQVERKIFSEVDSFLEPVNVLFRPQRSDIIDTLSLEFADFVADNMRSVMCAPLQGELKTENGRYLVDLGARHGLSTSKLAVLSSGQQPWTVMRVSGLEAGRIFLTPLDPSRDLNGLVGQTVRFLEAHQYAK